MVERKRRFLISFLPAHLPRAVYSVGTSVKKVAGLRSPIFPRPQIRQHLALPSLGFPMARRLPVTSNPTKPLLKFLVRQFGSGLITAFRSQLAYPHGRMFVETDCHSSRQTPATSQLLSPNVMGYRRFVLTGRMIISKAHSRTRFPILYSSFIKPLRSAWPGLMTS